MNALADIFQQPAFHRAGWVLIHFLWQGAGIGLLLAVLLRLLNKASSHLRYLVICGALLACGIAPAVTWGVLARHAAPPPRVLQEPAGNFAAGTVISMLPPVASIPETQVLPVGTPAIATSKPLATSWHARGLQTLDPLLPYLVCLWLAGVLVLTIRLALGWMQLQRIRSSGVAITDHAWGKKFRDLAERMRVSAPVRLLKSALVEVPTLIGWLRPVILLPASVFTGLSAGQLEAILAHELAHVRRYDYLVNLFQTAIETILFYHPAVWWISRKLREERENCCDDIAVETVHDRATYASALAALEECRVFPPRLAMAVARGTLLGRIRRIAGVECGKSSLAPIVAAFLIIGSLLAPFGNRLASGEDTKTTSDKSAVEQQIVAAVRNNDTTALQKLLDQPGVDPGKIKDHGILPLLFDARSPEVAELLIRHGANVNEKMEDGETPLFKICDSGGAKSAETARALLKHGADPNASSYDGTTPLMWANDGATVDVLVEFGADLKAKRDDGLPLIDFLPGYADLSRIDALIQHGVPFDPQTDGPTMLVSAAQSGKTDIMEFLLKKGVDPNTRGVWRKINDNYKTNGDYRTPLQCAVLFGNYSTVKFLVEHGAKVQPAPQPVNPALDWTKKWNEMELALYARKPEVVRLFWEHGFRVISGLTYAMSQGASVDEIEKLLDSGTPADPPQDTQITPLVLAARLGNFDAVKLLAGRHAKIDGADPRDTPIAFAAQDGRDDIVEYLLKHGAHPDAEAVVAAINDNQGHFEHTVKLLIDAGALKNVTQEQAGFILGTSLSPDGYTGNHVNTSVLQMLLDAGLSPEAPLPGFDGKEKETSVIGYYRGIYNKLRTSGDGNDAAVASAFKPLLDMLEKADAGKTPKQGDITSPGNDSITDSQNAAAEKLITDAAKNGEVPADLPAAMVWYDTLGFPDVTNLPYVQAIESGTTQGQGVFTEGFLVSEDADSFTIFICNAPGFDDPNGRLNNSIEYYPTLTTMRFARKHAGPQYGPAEYKVLDFKSAVAGIPDRLRSQASKSPLGLRGGQPPLSHRARIFALGRACLQKGMTDTGLALMTIAANIRGNWQTGEVNATASLRDNLQEDIGDAVITEAELEMGDTSNSWGDLEKNYENFETRFPACGAIAYAKESAALLQTMSAEQAAHHPKPVEQMSPAERVAEDIYQLRNDYDPLSISPTQSSAVQQLIDSGFAAVPQLIATLGDRRFTRTLPPTFSGLAEPHDKRVGEFVLPILESISGRKFSARQQIEAWWTEVNKNGGKPAPIKTGSTGGELAATLPHEAAAPAAPPQGAAKTDLASALVAAAKTGDAAAAERLLQQGADPNDRGTDPMENALFAAARENHTDVVRLFLKHGANPNCENACGNKLIDWVLYQGHLEMAGILRDAGAKISPEGWAAATGDVPALKTMAQKGVFKKGTDGAMPYAVAMGQFDAVKFLEGVDGKPVAGKFLRKAAMSANIKMMEYLLSQGANIKTDGTDAMDMAVIFFDQPESVKFLLAHGVDPNRLNPWNGHDLDSARSAAVVKILLDAGANPDAEGMFGPPLSTAPDAESVRLLVQHGANLKPKLKNGETLVEKAVFPGHVVNTDVIEELIKQGAEFDPKGNGASALVKAADLNDVDAVRVLLDHGVSPDAFVDNAWKKITALGAAARSPGSEVLQLLLARGANPSGDPRETFSPLGDAISVGRPENAELLRKTGAHDVGELSSAAAAGDIAKVGVLLKSGANVNETDHAGQTPLAYAVRRGQVEIAKLLLNHGANVDLFDSWGSNPYLTYMLFQSSPSTATFNWGDGNISEAEAARRLAAFKELFAKHPPDPNYKDDHGRTALQQAVLAGNVMTAEFLLTPENKHGADPNLPDPDGKPPILLAALSPHAKETVVKINVDDGGKNPLQKPAGWNAEAYIADRLINAGAKLDLIVADGRTAGDLAIEAATKANNPQLISVLQAAGAKLPSGSSQALPVQTPSH